MLKNIDPGTMRLNAEATKIILETNEAEHAVGNARVAFIIDIMIDTLGDPETMKAGL